MRRGAPDFLIFTNPAVAIEMKRVKGSKVSPDQIEFLEELSGHGWRCFVTYGHEAAALALEKAGHPAGVNYGRANHRYEEITHTHAAPGPESGENGGPVKGDAGDG